jgi:hypothetical protein
MIRVRIWNRELRISLNKPTAKESQFYGRIKSMAKKLTYYFLAMNYKN